MKRTNLVLDERILEETLRLSGETYLLESSDTGDDGIRSKGKGRSHFATGRFGPFGRGIWPRCATTDCAANPSLGTGPAVVLVDTLGPFHLTRDLKACRADHQLQI